MDEEERKGGVGGKNCQVRESRMFSLSYTVVSPLPFISLLILQQQYEECSLLVMGEQSLCESRRKGRGDD